MHFRVEKKIETQYVFQELDNLPEGFTVPDGRAKPWGTGHAVLSCQGVVKEPCAIVSITWGSRYSDFISEIPPSFKNPVNPCESSSKKSGVTPHIFMETGLSSTWISGVLYPRRCPVCMGIATPRGALVHGECLAKLRYIREPSCKCCGRQIFRMEAFFDIVKLLPSPCSP